MISAESGERCLAPLPRVTWPLVNHFPSLCMSFGFCNVGLGGFTSVYLSRSSWRDTQHWYCWAMGYGPCLPSLTARLAHGVLVGTTVQGDGPGLESGAALGHSCYRDEMRRGRCDAEPAQSFSVVTFYLNFMWIFNEHQCALHKQP